MRLKKGCKNPMKEVKKELFSSDTHLYSTSPEDVVKSEIYDWLSKDPYQDFLSYMKSRVIGQDEVEIITANVYNYLKRVSRLPGRTKEISSTKANSNNVILSAPSGCGKTETYRALKDYFSNYIPSLIISSSDVSQITASGYRGPEPYSICDVFFQTGMIHPIGIVFMDEFDKLINPSYNSDHWNTHLEAQANILTIIEGGRIEGRSQRVIYSDNLMFVGIGSFNEFRKTRIEKASNLGFLPKDQTQYQYDAPITREHMIESGASYELIGRFPYIMNYYSLSDETIRKIIDKIKQSIEADFECEITMENQMEQDLFTSSKSKYGCRLLDSMIRSLVLKAYSKALMDPVVGDVLVVTLHDKDTYSYVYRSFSEEELVQKDLYAKTLEMFDKENNDDEDSKPRVTLEDILSSMI